MPQESELRAALATDAGDPVFADLVALLIVEGRFFDAIIVGMQGLSRNPECHKGRLLLAHALFRADLVPFAAQEVRGLCSRFPGHPHLNTLLSKLDPTGSVEASALEQSTAPDAAGEVADVEFDLDILDELGKKGH